jgi:glycosyltransferase involved in cell wall biosynthesis
MKILHINTSDNSGGASIAAFRLHNTMLNNGIDSKYLVLHRTINDRHDIISLSKYDRYIKKNINTVLEKIARKGLDNTRGLYSFFLFGIDVSKYLEVINPDIIYLHWICGSFINYRILKRILKTGKPVFWFMHDMFPITGGCHYSFECTKYYSKCSRCSFYKKNTVLPDLSAMQFSVKCRIYKQFDNLAFIAPSKWMAGCARMSGLTKDKHIYHIPNLIDPARFKAADKNAVRGLFSIGREIKVIAFGADSALSNPYKGWVYFRDALRLMAKENVLTDTPIEVLVFGSSYNREIAGDIPFPCHFLGKLCDEYSMIMMYSCVDVFVIPSLADNFPNTILESVSCNIPVVGFNVGGIPDMVNDHTGYLARYKDSADLAKGIMALLLTGKKDVSVHASPFYANAILDLHKNMWESVNTPPPPPPHVVWIVVIYVPYQAAYFDKNESSWQAAS